MPVMRSGRRRIGPHKTSSLLCKVIAILLLMSAFSLWLFRNAPPDTIGAIATEEFFNFPRASMHIPSVVTVDKTDAEFKTQLSKSIYEVIEELYMEGINNPAELARKLVSENPLNIPPGPDNYTCPSGIHERLSLPDLVNHTRSAEFRAGKKGTWLFYQHLRKAGGTGFCDLAQNNLPRRQTPPYFCMIDNRGSLATPPWNNEEYLMSRMERNDFRITANEWDAYYSHMGDWRGTVLATTFRHPVDRWYSQYRFEHLEHRDGSRLDAPRRPFRTWYNNNKLWTMGINYYITTFVGTPDDHPPHNKQDFYWTYHKFVGKPITWDMFRAALENVRKFHVVLVTEWLDSAPPLIDRVLGWKTPPKKVLPHESQAKRDSNYRKVPVRETVGDIDYNFVLEENVLDLLFFHCMQRIYLERLHFCDDVG